MTQPIPLPFGLREIDVTPFTTSAATAYGTRVKLPYARQLQFAEAVESTSLRGDDEEIASRETAPAVEWSIESGGLPFEAMAVMYGGTVTETGVTPNRVKKWRKHKNDGRPYFRIRGRAISDSGGDVWGIIYKAKATDNMEGTFGDGEFFLSSGGGRGIASTVPADLGYVWDFVQNETPTALS